MHYIYHALTLNSFQVPDLFFMPPLVGLRQVCVPLTEEKTDPVVQTNRSLFQGSEKSFNLLQLMFLPVLVKYF